MTLFKAGFVYFCAVFGAGFLLGMIRVPFLVPRLGVRMAELVEMPVMLVVIVVCARWIVWRYAVPRSVLPRLWMGCLALVLVLAAEFGLLLVQGKTIAGYLAARDSVSGSVFAALLVLMALMPVLIRRRKIP